MSKWLGLFFVLVVTGCAQQPQPQETEQEVSTSQVDAVEGNKKEDVNLLDVFRHRKDPVSGDPAWGEVQAQPKAEHYSIATGSLFNREGAQDLYDDTKPRGVGDIVTIVLEEKTTASKSAAADLSKKNASNMEPLDVGGRKLNIKGYKFSYDLQNNNTFTGESSADQKNSLIGNISVQVIKILPNGNLIVRGEKWVTLNTGDEFVRLSGIIRPEDIDNENNISSKRVANAKIQYSSTGDQKDVQEQGWVGRFFNVAF